ncbi:CHRD domain-containing protein [Halovivax limisalsi]|uniref:CHRD domain-containing protein n=1 Tax=Halovivax limisalsi TaxID=1453760 RepID=UPI001FFDBCDD|nr:CHRD domain-containing protein [Halovivax limisalsi]
MTAHTAADERPTDGSRTNDFGVDRRSVLALAGASALGLGSGVASADSHDGDDGSGGLFLAAATGGQQTEDVDTEAAGGAAFSLSEDGSEMEYALLVSAIEDVTQAHIHLGGAGENGPVAVWLYPDPEATEPELQEGRFDGVLATGTFTEEHLTDAVEGGTMDALLEAIEGGGAYVNVHTEEYPAGEIRGQLTSAEDVAAALQHEHDGDAVDETDERDGGTADGNRSDGAGGNETAGGSDGGGGDENDTASGNTSDDGTDYGG